MDNQSILSGNPGSFASPGRSSGPLMIIVVVILGLGAVIFGALTISFYGKAATATKTLSAQKQAAAAAAKTQQKKTDDAAARAAGESPFRSYTAPDSYGAFVIKFPKDWSSYVDQETFGTQVSLNLNPDFVRRSNGTDQPTAARVLLEETPQAQYMSTFQAQVKNGAMKQAAITVSGQPGFDLTGKFSDRKTVREVVVPVRDKILVFTSENSQYANEFNEILAQAKIIP